MISTRRALRETNTADDEISHMKSRTADVEYFHLRHNFHLLFAKFRLCRVASDRSASGGRTSPDGDRKTRRSRALHFNHLHLREGILSLLYSRCENSLFISAGGKSG